MTHADWTVSLLGTGSFASATYRALPATLIETPGAVCLVDCGDGTATRLRGLTRPRVDLVALTGTSSSELSGMLALGETNRRATRHPLRVVGPTGLKKALESVAAVSSASFSELFDADELIPGQAIEWTAGEYLESVAVDCSPDGANCAYLVFEAPLPGRVDAEAAMKRGIRGGDFARLVAGETVRGVRPADIIGPARPGRRMTVVARGRLSDDLRVALEGSDVAVFAAPFMDDRLEVAQESSYFTGWEAADVAAQAGVRLVLLQQLGPYAPTGAYVAEARQYHSNLFAPNDGASVRVPLPEVGPPRFDPRGGTTGGGARPTIRQPRRGGGVKPSHA